MVMLAVELELQRLGEESHCGLSLVTVEAAQLHDRLKRKQFKLRV